jgi:hypothetical protein
MRVAGNHLNIRMSEYSLQGDNISAGFDKPGCERMSEVIKTEVRQATSAQSARVGLENELYFMDKTLMLFGDAKGFVGEIIKSLPKARE